MKIAVENCKCDLSKETEEGGEIEWTNIILWMMWHR